MSEETRGRERDVSPVPANMGYNQPVVVRRAVIDMPFFGANISILKEDLGKDFWRKQFVYSGNKFV